VGRRMRGQLAAGATVGLPGQTPPSPINWTTAVETVPIETVGITYLQQIASASAHLAPNVSSSNDTRLRLVPRLVPPSLKWTSSEQW